MDWLAIRKKGLIKDSLEVRGLNEKEIVIGAKLHTLGDLLSDAINRFNFKLVPFNEQVTKDKYEKMVEGCFLFDVKPCQ